MRQHLSVACCSFVARMTHILSPSRSTTPNEALEGTARGTATLRFTVPTRPLNANTRGPQGLLHVEFDTP